MNTWLIVAIVLFVVGAVLALVPTIDARARDVLLFGGLAAFAASFL